uniref:conjugal transfer protein TraF n=1 Tax=Thaumasiovibrio occultus TaxID=1891184 RepID=UPI000B363608|nr:conjugal transfer protein TraF [Thaumasiovibrio occultus]
MKINQFAVAALAVACSTSALADARGVAMGGTGVATSNYLAAPFYNPALLAHYDQDRDNVGLLLPSLSVSVHDGDELYDKVDDFAMLTDELNMDPTNAALQDEWKAGLKALDDGRGVVEGQLGLVIAVPNQYASVSFFTKAEAMMVATAHIDDADLALDVDADCSGDIESCIQSTVQGLAGVVGDVGLTLAKEHQLTLAGREMRVSAGISPKFQTLAAINYETGASGFDENEFEFGDEYVETSGFNLDLGVALQPTDNLTIGLSAMNLMSQELDTNVQLGKRATFLVEPQYKLGVGYRLGLMTAAFDVDLTERSYFKGMDYSTQFARVGVEFDAWRWAQLRVGYQHSMTDHSEDVLSAGLGLTPFGRFGLDLSAQYGDDSRLGAAAQLIFTF